MKLIFATNNAHKLEEARAILKNVEILSLEDIGLHADIPETGNTLLDNSKQKTSYVYRWCIEHQDELPEGVMGCFADDTGLEITALDMAPGVYTARWSGEPVDSARNRKKALAELEGKEDRSARFRTVVTYSIWKQLGRDIRSGFAEGIVRGSIATEERGNQGFGYDPVFIPEGYDKTFAELPAEVKNGISHRARAMQAFLEKIH